MVSIAACPDYSEKSCDAALLEALNGVGGLDWVQPGMVVGIKVNLVTMLKPEAAATTHPALVCSLVRLLKERGADVVIGDSPGGLYNQLYVDRVYAAAGMKQAEQAGARLNRDFSCKEAHFPAARKAKRFEYTGWLDSCDAIINFCKLKTHSMMGMSAAVKNLFGAIPGTRKPEMHYLCPKSEDFADMLIDLIEYFHPVLHLVDAVVGMEGNGPTMGKARSIGCLVAGQSAYEVDQVCAKIIGVPEDFVPTLGQAKLRGLAPEQPEIAGDLTRWQMTDFELPPQHDVRFFAHTPLAPLMALPLQAKPAVKKELCVGCAKCREVCPAHAIEMKDHRPVINRKTCIRCFCCQEFCPKAAMVSRRPLIARLLNK